MECSKHQQLECCDVTATAEKLVIRRTVKQPPRRSNSSDQTTSRPAPPQLQNHAAYETFAEFRAGGLILGGAC